MVVVSELILIPTIITIMSLRIGSDMIVTLNDIALNMSSATHLLPSVYGMSQVRYSGRSRMISKSGNVIAFPRNASFRRFNAG